MTINSFFAVLRLNLLDVNYKGTVSPAERCDFVTVHELFQVCRVCEEGVVLCNMFQDGLLYHKSSL